MLEQRIGRIDRIGQEAEKIFIWNLGYADTIDERIYARLLAKLHIFERALGGMEAILGDLINELTSDLLSRPLTPEQEKNRIDAAYTAVEVVRQQQEQLEADAAHLIAHGGYILERVKAAHELKRRITDEDLKLYVRDYLHRYCSGFEFLEADRDPMAVTIRLPADTAAQLDEFIRKNRLHGQSRLASGDNIACRFANKVRSRRQREEPISQFHPFIRFISAELTERHEAFYPLVAVRIDRQVLPGIEPGTYAFSAKRWTFIGLRVEEQVHSRALLIGSNSPLLDTDRSWELVNAARVEGEDWLSAQNELDVDAIAEAFDLCDMRLDRDYRILDFTTFNVWREKGGDDLFPIFARAVKPLGTRFLIERRLNAARDSLRWKPSPFDDMPTDSMFREKLHLTASQLSDVDRHFRTEVGDVIREKLRYTKERRTPLSLNWDSGPAAAMAHGGNRGLDRVSGAQRVAWSPLFLQETVRSPSSPTCPLCRGISFQQPGTRALAPLPRGFGSWSFGLGRAGTSSGDGLTVLAL